MRAYTTRKKLDIMGAITFRSPTAIKPAAMTKARMYPRRGSFPGPYPTPKCEIYGKRSSLQTAWNALGAPTRLASADDKVDAKTPAVTIGPHPAANFIT